MNNVSQKIIAFSSFVAGLALLVPLATLAGQQAARNAPEPTPIVIPEVVITGQAPIVVPEVVIAATPSRKARVSRVTTSAGHYPMGLRALEQGGRPGARFVRAF